jgi:hypothetical protein
LDIPSLDTIKEFGRQLRQMKWLKKLSLGSLFLEEYSEGPFPEYYEPLIQAMQENYSIECFEVKKCGTPQQYDILRYYAHLNHAGRRILETTPFVPVGLWPWILERAGRSNYFETSCTGYVQECRANAIYFFLQHCPDILSNVQSRALEGNSRKKAKI